MITQYVLFVVVLVVLAFTIDWPKIQETFFDFKATREMYPDLFTVALKNTVIYTVSAYVVGFVLGLVVALMRLSSVALYRWVALLFVEIFRGLPALLTLLIIGFGLPVALGGPVPGGTVGAVAVGLGLVAAAYMAETFRAGIQAVPRGQMEAARSLGMSYPRAMFSIVIPQGLRIIIPPLTNELVLLFKDSSLVSALGIAAAGVELTKMGSDFAINTADATPFVVAGASYLIITVPLGIVVRRLEARQAKAR
ncbi:amino acid ABC transporter permease [Actinomadura kijaniata]|uniref:Polar amino acid transport system permease protein n=1 Tax=Actinomadura namibiensis TaxID=182080 RepID=A0A7W3LIZ8_ACTNM|nr:MULTISPECIES: amino acid ABC transporter permease [Actinomadura]MBA8948954.1 polar amino acid transport system permease protein [Actinomadura namibiensis]